MAGFQNVISNLRTAEETLKRQLAGIQHAIVSLESGGVSLPGRAGARKGAGRKRRISAAGRARIAAAQRARWAKVRAAKKIK
jgi:hypothetical protein